MRKKVYWLAAIIVIVAIACYSILWLRARPVSEHPFFNRKDRWSSPIVAEAHSGPKTRSALSKGRRFSVSVVSK